MSMREGVPAAPQPCSTADPLPSSGQAGPCGPSAWQGWSPKDPQHAGVHPRPGAGELGGVWGGRLQPWGWGLTLFPAPQEGTLVCSSMLAGWRQGAVATFTTVFQGDSYKVGAHVLGLGQWGAGSLVEVGGHRGL